MPAETLREWEGHDADYWRSAWHAGAVHLFESIGSTNDFAIELAAEGAPHLSVILAEAQTHGRGRAGSGWHARPGTSLLFSVLLRIDRPGAGPGCAPVRLGLVTAEAIADLTSADAHVKWPNDVVIPGHGKVAGILCEGAFAQKGGGFVIAGIGINVFQTDLEFARDVHGHACSILSATGARLDRAALLTRVLQGVRDMAGRITDWLNGDELERLSARDILRNLEVVCEAAPGKMVAGVARGIAQDGALMIHQHDHIVQVYNGTVRLADRHAYPGA